MSNEGSVPITFDGDGGARARGELVEFLNGNRPAMLVADSLEFLLRTEPPSNVEPEEIVELLAAWADERAAGTGEATSVLMLGALRRLLEAHAEVRLEGFDPDRFVTTIGEGLGRHCPASEVGGFRSALGSLVGAEPAVAPPPAGAGEDGVEIRGVRMAVRDAQEAAVSRVEHDAYMTDDDFERAFEDLERALSTRVGSNIHAILARVAKAAARIFNTGRGAQAARICEFLNASYDRLSLSPEGRREVAFSVVPTDLNEGLLAKLLNDPAKRADAVAIVRTVGYFQPSEALSTLAVENRRERRRLLLAAIEAFGADAIAPILDQLTSTGANGPKWYATRNFLYLLSRVDAPDEASRRRAIEAAGRFVANDQPQVRSAAIAALRRIGGREVVPYVVRALDPTSYAPGSIDDSDALRRHLGAALETIVETANEAAMSIAAEFATGGRGSEFDLGPSLRDEACSALMRHKGPLPRRAALVVANHLLQVCGRRFKLVTGRLSFGLDVHHCQMLSALIRSSSEPECREALEHPVLVKVLARTTGDLA